MFFIIGVVIVFIIFFSYMWFEATLLKVEQIDLSRNRVSLKLLHISDIHVRFLKVSSLKIKKVIMDEKPDIIVMTGDYIDDVDEISDFLKLLDKVLNNEMVFMTFGNHDYRAFRNKPEHLKKFAKEMGKRNIKIFENEKICIENKGRKYNFIGLSDLKYGKNNYDEVICNNDDGEFCNIVFSHNPDIVIELENEKIDILLCGHFHGGQITVPFGLEFKLLRNEKLCKIGYVKGLKEYKGIKIYLNRGIGNVCIPLRFLSRPEIAVIKI